MATTILPIITSNYWSNKTQLCKASELTSAASTSFVLRLSIPETRYTTIIIEEMTIYIYIYTLLLRESEDASPKKM
jgi:hypothetical protein